MVVYSQMIYIEQTFQCNYWPRKKGKHSASLLLPKSCLQPFFGVSFSSDSQTLLGFTRLMTIFLSCGFSNFFGATSKVLLSPFFTWYIDANVTSISKTYLGRHISKRSISRIVPYNFHKRPETSYLPLPLVSITKGHL